MGKICISGPYRLHGPAARGNHGAVAYDPDHPSDADDPSHRSLPGSPIDASQAQAAADYDRDRGSSGDADDMGAVGAQGPDEAGSDQTGATDASDGTLQLTPIEARMLGSLAEKALATPQNYPLSINALVAACN
ncbi:MAG: DUF480 domain-containing protein, partial [Actinomycetota bacterium]|nr:DUF480 domain-containing protein [Actinomycetota bacterium]